MEGNQVVTEVAVQVPGIVAALELGAAMPVINKE